MERFSLSKAAVASKPPADCLRRPKLKADIFNSLMVEKKTKAKQNKKKFSQTGWI